MDCERLFDYVAAPIPQTFPTTDYRPDVPRPVNQTTPLGRIMHAQGVSVMQLARDCLVNERMISYYTSGQRPISPTHLAIISEVLGRDPEELVYEDYEEAT